MKNKRNSLYFYSTDGCHLCELALEVLNQESVLGLTKKLGINLEKIDISESAELVERYGVRIPVIALEGRESDLGWPFDQLAVCGYLSSV